MKIRYLIAAAILNGCLCVSASAAVTATLDRDQVADGESVQLTLQHDGSTSGDPDTAPLKRDFDILGTSRSTNVQFINGHMSSQTQLSLTLSPKHTGRIDVPPIQWGDEQSSALGLTVGGTSTGTQSGSNAPASTHVFLTTTVDVKQPYVQAAVVMTVRLYYDTQLEQASLDLPTNSDVLIQQFGKDEESSENRNNRHYNVIERQYLLMPQKSGVLSLEGPVLNAQIADGNGVDPFFGRAFGMTGGSKPIRLHGETIELDVKPRPAAARGGIWLPAQQVTLQESWQPANANVHAGEPLTRHLQLSAKGLMAAQLPDLSTLMPTQGAIRMYPDQPKLDNKVEGGNLIGSRGQDIALIASQPGHYELPELHLAWWDTVSNVQREVSLPARSLDVLPAAAGATPIPPSTVTPPVVSRATTPLPMPVVQPARSTFPWPWISLGLGLLWLCTLAAWWFLRARRPANHSQPVRDITVQPMHANHALKNFREACRENAALSARRCLVEWGRATWPDDPPTGLNAIRDRMNDPEVSRLLQQLDRACYANGDWRGEDLARQPFQVVVKSSGMSRKLDSLYP